RSRSWVGDSTSDSTNGSTDDSAAEIAPGRSAPAASSASGVAVATVGSRLSVDSRIVAGRSGESGRGEAEGAGEAGDADGSGGAAVASGGTDMRSVTEREPPSSDPSVPDDARDPMAFEAFTA